MSTIHDKKNELKKVAEGRNLIIYSETYMKSSSKYLWGCKVCKNKWEASHNNIKNGKGCPKCALVNRIKNSFIYSFGDLQLAARKRKGRCLSKKYLGYHIKHVWECNEGHTWSASAELILRRKTWCPYCDGQKLLEPLVRLRKVARLRGGTLVSKKYVNNKSKLKLKCNEGHLFALGSSSLLNGQWCRQCSMGMGEAGVRQVFEQLLGVKFHSIWPQWLKSPKGRPMQLDGYNEKLKIAFEHQGLQHLKSIPFFEKQGFSFGKRKKYDSHKRKLCKSKGVLLIEIPQVPTVISFANLAEFIAAQLKAAGINVSKKKIHGVKLNFRTTHTKRKLSELRSYAKLNQGKLLSNSYSGAFVKHKWKCKLDHIWDAIPANMLRKGYWCPTCGIEKRISSRMTNSKKLINSYK